MSPRRVAAHVALLALASAAAAGCGDDATGPGGPITRVEVHPVPINAATTNLTRDRTIQLIAVPVNDKEQFVDLQITWSSSDNARATVDADGLVTTIAGGDVTISAAAGGQTGTFDLNVQYPVGTVTVAPPAGSIRQEGSVTLAATLLGTDGEPAVGRTVAWSSSNTAVATVNSSGRVSGVTDGTVTITATSEGVMGATQVTVSGPALVATVTVTPAGPFAGVGQAVQMTQTSRAQSGTILAGTSATWTSSATSVATVDVNGLVTVVGPGTTNITATVDNGEGTNILGSTSLEGATVLANGASITVPDVDEEAFIDYAFVSNGTVASFSVVTSGGTAGDSDMHIFAPGVVPAYSAANLTYTNFVCRPWNVGSDETCTINTPVAGTYRIRFYNYPGEGVLAGMSAILTHP